MLPKGDKGDKGDTGDIGPIGPKGEKGDIGPKGEPFVYSDFTAEQLAGLKGPKGDKGENGDKGDKGDTGAAFTYDMFTPDQLEDLVGPKGDKGDTGPQGPAGPGFDSATIEKVGRLHNYTTATTVAGLNVNYEEIYVTLSANASLSVSATGSAYNGRTITAYVYCSSARTITIPTSGSYMSMCGSSYTCPAGKSVEFNLKCINAVWRIAKLEQE